VSDGAHRYVIAWGWLMAALALSVVPWPGVVNALNPDWVVLLLIYTSVTDPRRFGLLTAFLAGLALDVMNGALLGQNALALITISYLCARFHFRVRAFPLSQIVGWSAALLLLYQFMLFWIDGVVGLSVGAGERLGPVVSGTIILFIAWILRDYDQRDTRMRIGA
jgi:rod shape-determining protein MreD